MSYLQKNKFYSNFVRSILLLSFLFFAASCDDDDNDSIVDPPATEANIRVIHASYDAPSVDVRVNDNVAISNLAYRESSGYASVPAGQELNLKVSPAGAADPVVIETDQTFSTNNSYTIFAVNQLQNIEAVLVSDDRTPNSGNAKVRFVHASPDAPAVDIKVSNGSGTALFSNASFRSVTDYINVDQGTYDLAVTPAGSTVEVIVLSGVPLTNGVVYTVAATGTLDGSDTFPFEVRAFIDSDNGDGFADLQPGTANVLVTHASPDAPGVDLLVDNVVAGSNLAFPNNTGYLTVNSGTRNVKVNVTGTATTVINADLALAKDANYSVFAVDEVANITALVIEDDLTAPASGNAHVRFLHLSPDAPAVDITLTDGTVVFGNYSFKQFTDFTPLPSGSYDLQVRLAGTDTVVLDLPGIALDNGKIYSVFARGFVGGSGEQALGAQIIVNN